MAARQIAEWGFGLAVREGEQAARRGAISVGRARWRNPITGENQPFTIPEGQPEQPPLIAAFDAPTDTGAPQTRDTLSLTFLTPTRLVLAGATLKRPEPDVLLRRVAERIDAVAASVGVAPPNLLADEAFLAALAHLELRTDETQWVGDAAKGGFTGSATLGGPPDDLARIAHVLNWGAALGVGKGTLHGAGRFVVAPSRCRPASSCPTSKERQSVRQPGEAGATTTPGDATAAVAEADTEGQPKTLIFVQARRQVHSVHAIRRSP